MPADPPLLLVLPVSSPAAHFQSAPPSVPVGSQVGYWLMLITVARRQEAGGRGGEDATCSTEVYLCVAADTLNPTLPPSPWRNRERAPAILPADHSIIGWGGGRVWGRYRKGWCHHVCQALCRCSELAPTQRRVHTPFPPLTNPRMWRLSLVLCPSHRQSLFTCVPLSLVVLSQLYNPLVLPCCAVKHRYLLSKAFLRKD